MAETRSARAAAPWVRAVLATTLLLLPVAYCADPWVEREPVAGTLVAPHKRFSVAGVDDLYLVRLETGRVVRAAGAEGAAFQPNGRVELEVEQSVLFRRRRYRLSPD